MNSEEEFQAALDAQPEDAQTRSTFADWLNVQSEPRAAGYRALALLKRYPHRGRYHNRGHSQNRAEAWWWYRPPDDVPAEVAPFHNILPADWFALLPTDNRGLQFWPQHTESGGVKTRRECEDAAALAFATLPPQRRAELLASCDG